MLKFIPVSEPLSIGGHQLTISALPMGILRRQVMPLLDSNLMEADNYDKILSICHMSVSQTDPSITIEDIENALMLTDLVDLFQAVVRVSGLNRKDISTGEAQSQKQAIQPASGATHTDLSQPLQVGDMTISTPS